MMSVTLSLPLVLADADDDATVVAGMASAIPAASAPVTFDFMVSPGIAGTAHDRGPAHPSHPRKIRASTLVCRGADLWPAPASRVRCAHRVVSRNCGPACATRAYHMQEALSLFEKWPSEHRGPVLAAAPAASLAPAELAR